MGPENLCFHWETQICRSGPNPTPAVCVDDASLADGPPAVPRCWCCSCLAAAPWGRGGTRSTKPDSPGIWPFAGRAGGLRPGDGHGSAAVLLGVFLACKSLCLGSAIEEMAASRCQFTFVINLCGDLIKLQNERVLGAKGPVGIIAAQSTIGIVRGLVGNLDGRVRVQNSFQSR